MIDRKTAEELYKSAEKYKRYFLNNNIAFVLYDKNEKEIQVIETFFRKTSFMHLVGIQSVYKTIEGNIISAEDVYNSETTNAQPFYHPATFFDACIDKKLNLNNCDNKPNGTTLLKLDVISYVFNENMNAKMFGNYNGIKPLLYTEKIAGNNIAGIGFIKEKSGYYVPNTVIKEDIRDITNNCVRVIAIYKKHKDDDNYNKRIYLAKKVDLSYYNFPEEYEYLKSIT